MKATRLLSVLLAALSSVPHTGAAATPIPVLAAMPACGLERVGSVVAHDGSAPVANAHEVSMASANYARVFSALSAAAAARGGEAVVLTGHNAMFFTRGNRTSQRPVFIELRGFAIRFADRTHCMLVQQDPDELLRRAIQNRRPATIVETAPTN